MFKPLHGGANATAAAPGHDCADAPHQPADPAADTSQEIKDLNEKIEVLEKQVSRLVEAQQSKG